MRKPCSNQDTSQEIRPTEPGIESDPVVKKPSEGNDEPDDEEDELIPLEAVFDVEESASPTINNMPKEDSDNDEMHDAIGDEDGERQCKDEIDGNSDIGVKLGNNDSKTFYLFTRTSREKEEWFNKFMVGARFMQDWNHQNPPKERLTMPDPNYETYKVKEQKFRIFMENYFQVRNREFLGRHRWCSAQNCT